MQSVKRLIPRGLVLLGVLCQAAIVDQPRATADDDESGVSQADVGLPRVIVRGGGHFPVVVRLRSGELAAVMRGHYEHVLGDASLDIVRSTDEGASWSAPRTAIDAKNVDDRNPAFGQLADGTLVLAFARYDMAQSRSTGVWSARSADGGQTWDEPTQVSPPQTGGGSPYGKIVELPDGVALLSIYSSDDLRREPVVVDGRERAWLLRSSDSGRTWGDPSLIAEGFNETALCVLSDNRLLAALRKSSGPEADSLWLARSDDGGRSWSEPRQVAPRGEHPADLLRMPDGSLLLCHGVRHDPARKFGGYDSDESVVHQMGVEAMFSSDEGKSWGREVVLDHTAPNYDCGYPSSVLLKNGRILTLYYVVTGKADYDLAGAQTRCVIWGRSAAK